MTEKAAKNRSREGVQEAREAAVHARRDAVERQQRAQQHYADKVAAAPEVPSRAQSESRTMRAR